MSNKQTRVIKFRAWDSFSKEMYVNSHTPAFWSWCEMQRGFTPIVMQFTGYHDQNGKEIYEGDIVEEKNESYTHVSVVMWHEDRFVISSDKSSIKTGMSTIFTELKIIGNIYENPELLPKD